MAFQGLLPEFTQKNVAIVGCSNDGAARARARARARTLTLTLALSLALNLALALT